ncbi:LLM class flavin-dependent oxidoreductase [Polluticaenibacter yanchengensis]|uniref:LLM class flavin-dependent oxidoreductase n=1 Tax=Polluticaenibacter yanchengensis TaxID=3014562 RepID=A0ABT4UM00_9BACT|nr:LLM class flavin-dependent oxidoreductase [Chitinophagaceae bacterium LY-5]
MVHLSILDLAIIAEGDSTLDAINRTVKVAQHAEKLGYKRIWLAEHHNMKNIASSSTALLISHVAAHTTSIRVGSGGIMLPNHSPLSVAEAFGTLDILYPNRIELGLGRAPGTDQLTAMALRRGNSQSAYNFPSDIKEIQNYFYNTDADAKVRAFPGEGNPVPIYILGSSTDSAYLAAEMGLPYAFAAHFAPAQLTHAMQIYQNHFKPSRFLDQPYSIACVNVYTAPTEEEAHFLSTSLYKMFINLVTNQRGYLQPPGDLPETYNHPQVQHMVKNMLDCTFIGNPQNVKNDLNAFAEKLNLQEIMMSTNIYDTDAKLRSYQLVKEAFDH